VRQCADGARPELRRVFGVFRRFSNPMTIVVLAVAGTMLLYFVSAWLMLDAMTVGNLSGR